jgi:protein TonB
MRLLAPKADNYINYVMVKFLEVHKSVLTLCLMIWFGTNVFSQSTTPIDTTTEIVTYVEIMPEFPGGLNALYKYLGSAIKYPKIDKENNVTGRVVAQFTIDTLGFVRDVEITKSVSPTIDAEALRVISGLPQWKPATQNGKPVNLRMTLPITFKMDDAKPTSKTVETIGLVLGVAVGMTTSLLIGAWLKRVL